MTQTDLQTKLELLQNEFCSYEQALALKELGFDEPCSGRYHYQEAYSMLRPNSDEKEIVFEFGQYINQTNVTILAPLKQQVFRWFREKYNADVVIQPEVVGYYAKILINNKSVFDIIQTYEEAEDACIDKLIEIIKTN